MREPKRGGEHVSDDIMSRSRKKEKTSSLLLKNESISETCRGLATMELL